MRNLIRFLENGYLIFRETCARARIVLASPRVHETRSRGVRGGKEGVRRGSGVDRPRTPTSSTYYAVNPIPCILDIKFSAGLLSSA